MSGFAYFWGERTATVTGSAVKHITCVRCGHRYDYTVVRTAEGKGYSPYLLFAGRAERDSRERAYDNLRDQLYEAVDWVHCPNCGTYQPNMVRDMQNRFGNKFDPNINSDFRLIYSPEHAWSIARQANSRIAYENFMRLWPLYASLAQEKMEDLKMRRWVREALWNWGPLAGVLLAFLVLLLFSFVS